MKKLLFIMLAFMSAFMVSCNDDDSMEWEKTSYERVKQNNLNYYKVSADGGSFTFSCKNYEVKLGGVDVQFKDSSSYFCSASKMEYIADMIDVTCSVNQVKVNIQPNYGRQRTFTVEVWNSDHYSQIPFLQEEGKAKEENTSEDADSLSTAE